MQSSRSIWVIGTIQLVFVIAVVAGALALSASLKPSSQTSSNGAATQSSVSVITVSVIQPDPIRFAPALKLNGVVGAQSQTDIAAQVGGRVIRVGGKFKPGGAVQRGDVLFQINPVDFRLAVNQADANISAAEADIAQLEAEAGVAIEEWAELFPGTQIADLAARVPQIKAAKARLSGALASRETATLALDRTTVRAMEDARVLTAAMSIGQVIGANQIVGQTFPLSGVEVVVPLSTTQLATLGPAIGRDVTLRIGGSLTEARMGTVVRVDATLDARTRLARLFIRPNTAIGLTVGSFADVLISGPAQEGALELPKSSMATRDQVWVVADGVLAPRFVTVLGETVDAIVLGNFDVGDGVLTLPPVDAYEGQPVGLRETSQTIILGGSDGRRG